MELLFKIVGAVVVLSLFVVGMAALFTIPVYYLWNWLCPLLFHLPQVTFMQSWRLLVLCGFLFKSTGNTASKKG